MAYCLDMMAAAPTSMQRPFQQQIEDLVRELLDFLWCMADHNLSTLVLLPSTNFVDPSAPLTATGDPRDFPTILARMQVSPQQTKQLLATRRAWLHDMGALLAEPDNILAYLKDVEEKKGVVSMAGLMECGHVKEALSTTVHAMSMCRTFYLSYVYTHLFTPLQTARYVVGCLPMGPDLPALLSCLAKQYGEPSTEELLRAARPGTAACAPANTGAGAESGPGARSGSAAKSGSGTTPCSVATLGTGTNNGSSADSGLPPCMAGDWRRALTTPLRVLHGSQQQPSVACTQVGASGSPQGSGQDSKTGGYVGFQIIPCNGDGSSKPTLTFYAPLVAPSCALFCSSTRAPREAPR
ncbi:g8586 [Coccomyxa elongata]